MTEMKQFLNLKLLSSPNSRSPPKSSNIKLILIQTHRSPSRLSSTTSSSALESRVGTSSDTQCDVLLDSQFRGCYIFWYSVRSYRKIFGKSITKNFSHFLNVYRFFPEYFNKNCCDTPIFHILKVFSKNANAKNQFYVYQNVFEKLISRSFLKPSDIPKVLKEDEDRKPWRREFPR